MDKAINCLSLVLVSLLPRCFRGSGSLTFIEMASSPSKMECVTCNAPIDGYAESAACRYVGAGFCDACIISQSIDAQIAGPHLEKRAYPLKDFPVLSELDWDVAQILKHSYGQSNEAIAIALVANIPPTKLKEARYDLMCRAIANINEGQALRDQPLTLVRLSRRCEDVNKCATDIVELFKFVSCLIDDIPPCLKKRIVLKAKKNVAPPPSYASAINMPKPTSELRELQISTFIINH